MGLQERDIIIGINRQPISSVDDIRQNSDDAEPGDASRSGHRADSAVAAGNRRASNAQQPITRFPERDAAEE